MASAVINVAGTRTKTLKRNPSNIPTIAPIAKKYIMGVPTSRKSPLPRGTIFGPVSSDASLVKLISNFGRSKTAAMQKHRAVHNIRFALNRKFMKCDGATSHRLLRRRIADERNGADQGTQQEVPALGGRGSIAVLVVPWHDPVSELARQYRQMSRCVRLLSSCGDDAGP
jgi:hypothetical protein